MTGRLMVLQVTLLILRVYASPVTTTEDSDNMRQQRAQEILRYFNMSADPCEDFYEFTCGHYPKYVDDKLQGIYLEWDVLKNITRTMESKIISELRRGIQEDDTEADKKVKQIYASCLKIAKGSDQYNDRLKQLLSEFGKMPLLQSGERQGDDEADVDWLSLIAAIKHDTSIGILLSTKIIPDFTNTSRNRLALIQPSFFFDTFPYYVNEEFESFQTYLKSEIESDLTNFLGLNKTAATQAVEEIYGLEVALAEVMQNEDVTPSSEMFAVANMDDVQQKYLSAWDSKKFLKAAMDIEASPIIIQPKYLQNAYEIIQRTPNRVLANYIFYVYLYEYARALTPEDDDLEKHCAELMDKYFDEHLQNMAYRKFFHGDEGRLINVMWPEIKQAFEEVMKSSRLSWIAEEKTLEKALEKLRAMELKIDTYEEINFDQRFAELEASDSDILGNIRATLKMRSNRSKRIMEEPPYFGAESSTSPSYVFDENIIHIPIALLQTNMPWALTYPAAINFGSLGFYIAHEAVHGFDDTGRFYDDRGISRDWWDAASLKEHAQRVECFASQYESYTFKGKPLPHLLVQAENISDNGGLHLAYAAYQRWLNSSKHTDELERMQGLNFTNDQLFFISYSQSVCSSRDADYKINSLETHLPFRYRVFGSLSNSDTFAEAFNCSKGSTMNPLKKCEMY